jgi:hypothetical protein
MEGGRRGVRRSSVAWVVDALGRMTADELFGVQDYLVELVGLRESGDARVFRLADRFGGQGELVGVRRA